MDFRPVQPGEAWISSPAGIRLTRLRLNLHFSPPHTVTSHQFLVVTVTGEVFKTSVSTRDLALACHFTLWDGIDFG